MARDLTETQFRAALERHGMTIEGRGRFLSIKGGGISGGFVTFILGRRRYREVLSSALNIAERDIAIRDKRARIKAAWDAEFSQPIEPNFAKAATPDLLAALELAQSYIKPGAGHVNHVIAAALAKARQS